MNIQANWGTRSAMHSPAESGLRPLDHLVLPTADLAVARARLSALGFTVAPNGAHPFGTANCCVYFADGSFLEPLAVADQHAADRAADAGNIFVRRDRAYREGHGEEGFSALVMATDDARADDDRFRRAGVSAGDMLAFSRPFVDAEGREDTASFLLAFAADPAASGSFFFTCERVSAPKVDRSALERHANGVTGIASVFLSAPEPARHARLLRELTGGEMRTSPAGLEFQTKSGAVSVLNPDALKAALGIEVGGGDSLRFRAISFHVSDPAIAETLFARNDIARERRGARTIVAPAAGQGAHFIFEAQP